VPRTLALRQYEMKAWRPSNLIYSMPKPLVTLIFFLWIRGGKPRNRGSVSGVGKTFLCFSKSPDGLWGSSQPISTSTGSEAAGGVELTTHLHLAPRLRMCADISAVHKSRSPGRLNFVRWRLIFLDPQYGTCIVAPLWHP
jgi:hypothetical protein